jgi:hypothetical protein
MGSENFVNAGAPIDEMMHGPLTLEQDALLTWNNL